MHDELIVLPEHKDELGQCDIIDEIFFSGVDTNLIGILITPVCDIEQDKVDHFNLCAVLPFEDFFFKKIQEECKVDKSTFFAPTLSNGKTKEIVKFLKKILNNQYPRYHFIGLIPEVDGLWYIDYQLIQSVHINNESKLKKNILANILSPLKESIYVRFSNYLGRVGLKGEDSERKAYAKKIMERIKSNST